MPRKTKKDKMIVRLRRELASQRISRVPRVSKVSKARGPSSLPTLTTESATHNPQPTTQLSYPANLVKKDLTKTLALAILVISLEIGIYYLTKLKFLPL